MNTILLAIITASLVWSGVLREPVLHIVRKISQRRRHVAAKVARSTPDDVTMQLLLCDENCKRVEHEIAVHFADAPETYRYGGKDYRQEKRRHTSSKHDIIWEYRRVVILLALLLSAGTVFAQDSSVTLRRPDGTETGISTTPLRIDPTGSTVQPVSGTVTVTDGAGSLNTIIDSGTITTITNAVTVSQGTAANLNATVVGTGTFLTQAAQSGTWTIQPGNTANTTAWLVTGTGGTFPVTGTVAVTNADLTTLAGAVRAEDVASADAHTGVVSMAVRKAAPANTSNTDGDYEMLQVSAGRLWASATIDAAIPAGNNNIGDVDVVTVPTDPFGVNADAASATGSISAKLRFIASTGIPITGTVTVASHAVTNAGTFVVQENGAALTALQLIDNLPNTLGSTTSGQSGALALGAVTTAAPSYTNAQTNALSLDTAGALRVAGAVSCLNCSGSGASAVDDAAFTVGTSSVAPAGFLADQTAPDSVDEGDTGLARMTLARIQLNTLWDAAGNERGANVNASNELLVALSSVPSHAVTNAGTFVVQENGAALTALQLIDNLPNTIGSATSGQSGLLAFGAVTTAAPTYTTAQSNPLSIQTDGSLRTAVTNTVTVGSHAVTNAGTFVVQENGAALTSLQLIDDIIVADDAAFTPGTTKVAAVGYSADEASIDLVDENDIGAARMTLDRIAYAAPASIAATSQSWTTSYLASAASTNSTNVKNAAGNVYGFSVSNTTTTAYYLRMYNSSSAPTCSSATGFVETIPIPPAPAAGQIGGRERWPPTPQAYTTGISYCLTGGSSSTDNTSAATGLTVTIAYK